MTKSHLRSIAFGYASFLDQPQAKWIKTNGNATPDYLEDSIESPQAMMRHPRICVLSFSPPPPPAFRVQTVSARGSTKFSYKHKKHRQFSVDRMVKERMHLSPKESGYAYLAEFHISHFTDDWQDCFVRKLKLSENN